MMPQLYRLMRRPLVGKTLLCLLVVVYVGYLGIFAHVLFTSNSTTTAAIVDHAEGSNSSAEIQYWTQSNMLSAISADPQVGDAATVTQTSSAGKAAQQQGQAPADGNVPYPLSTVGKIFFTSSRQNYVCSGTAVVSSNHSVVDTAGHCLYQNGSWSQNVIFCPLYDHGNSSYGCWAAHDLEVPSDWINAKLNDLHHDMGMAIVSPNALGNLTDVVGGVGWAYNQPANQVFSAYGYPAGSPFDGQSRKSCESQTGKGGVNLGGPTISIPCNMTGGSSGGPWFIQINGNWYLNGHNDFTTTLRPGHMFSPYYDDTWYAMYQKAQQD